jgi:hypothetical protein
MRPASVRFEKLIHVTYVRPSHGAHSKPRTDPMKILRQSLLVLLLTVGTAACTTSSITGPDHTPDPGEFHTPDPGELHTPDPGM